MTIWKATLLAVLAATFSPGLTAKAFEGTPKEQAASRPDRPWPSDMPLPAFLSQVMRSIASHADAYFTSALRSRGVSIGFAVPAVLS